MKLNKTIMVGFIFILLAGEIFTTDLLNPIIRPVTYLFLMGSSKGKDIMFFGLLGLFMILPQLLKRDFNPIKYLKISMVTGWALLISGIVLEIIFRINMGIKLNTIFCSMTSTMSSTSILHTHLLKSILGAILTNLMGSFIQSNINTGVGLYSYLPDVAFLVILLIPILFVTLTLSIQKQPWPTGLLTAFFSSCLIIGSLDGGLFATPSIVGILGLYLIYRNGFYINYIIGRLLKDENILSKNENIQPVYRNRGFGKARFIFNRVVILIAIALIIFLRFTIAFAGAEPDYYTVHIENISDNVDFGAIPIEKIDNSTYHVDSKYNEMELINDLKIPLNNSCEYYTVSWNIYSYIK